MKLFLAMYMLSVFFVVFHFCNLIFQWRNQCRYILDYQCYKGTEDMKVDLDSFRKIRLRNKNLGPNENKFLLKTMSKSGIGAETCVPKSIIADREETPSLTDALLELEEIFYYTLDNLFAKSRISPSEIDILVVDVSTLYCVPSLTAQIINKYKMKDDIKVFNLSGMGCSASLIAINLVQNLFKSHKKAFAIVLSSESIGPNWYGGKEMSMLLTSCLFRSGGCSILLTNNRAFKHHAIFKLKSMVRTNLASKDEAYECVNQIEDDLGYRGVHLSKNLPKVVAQAITVKEEPCLSTESNSSSNISSNSSSASGNTTTTSNTQSQPIRKDCSSIQQLTCPPPNMCNISYLMALKRDTSPFISPYISCPIIA